MHLHWEHQVLEKLLSGFGPPSLSQSLPVSPQSQDEGYWNISAAHVHQFDLRPSCRFILIYAAMSGLAAKHVLYSFNISCSVMVLMHVNAISVYGKTSDKPGANTLTLHGSVSSTFHQFPLASCIFSQHISSLPRSRYANKERLLPAASLHPSRLGPNMWRNDTQCKLQCGCFVQRLF